MTEENKSIAVDVAALAKLAKLEVAPEELSKLEKEIPEILGFVETIQEVAADIAHESPEHHNVMREDENPHESGLYSKDLLDAAPAHKDGRVVVKQVISKK
ncbi:MAG: Asp-tRNA(Asn)/Glu-tRNA(Gln) amidotransferase subunit GatC [Minisyncoccia bacterium]